MMVLLTQVAGDTYANISSNIKETQGLSRAWTFVSFTLCLMIPLIFTTVLQILDTYLLCE
jgi:hypothetical protein